MGCCISRKETALFMEETIIYPFEELLGFSQYPYKEIINHLPTTTSSYISYSDLVLLLKSLSLPFHEFSEFYDYFERSNTKITASKKYSFLKLQSLFILLSKDDLKTKLMYWVSLYASQSKFLSKLIVDEMVENLIRVSIDYIQGYICSRNKAHRELMKYEKLTRSGKNFLAEDLSKKLRNDKQVVYIQEFYSNFSLISGEILLNPCFFRQKSFAYGLKYQTMMPRKKIDKKKIEESFAVFSSYGEFDFSLKSVNSSSIETVKKSSGLFSPESVKNVKENLRYGSSVNTPTKSSTALKSVASEKSVLKNKKNIHSRHFLFPSGDNKDSAGFDEIKIKSFAYANPEIDEKEESSDETEKNII